MKSLYDLAEEAYWMFDRKKKNDTLHRTERDTFKQSVIATFHAYPSHKICKWKKGKMGHKTQCCHSTIKELNQIYCQYCGGVIEFNRNQKEGDK